MDEALRQCFMSCVRQDILNIATDDGHYHIRKENSFAYYGGWLRDSFLYVKEGMQQDYDVYTKIHGLSPSVIRFKVDCEFLLILTNRMKLIEAQWTETDMEPYLLIKAKLPEQLSMIHSKSPSILLKAENYTLK